MYHVYAWYCRVAAFGLGVPLTYRVTEARLPDAALRLAALAPDIVHFFNHGCPRRQIGQLSCRMPPQNTPANARRQKAPDRTGQDRTGQGRTQTGHNQKRQHMNQTGQRRNQTGEDRNQTRQETHRVAAHSSTITRQGRPRTRLRQAPDRTGSSSGVCSDNASQDRKLWHCPLLAIVRGQGGKSWSAARLLRLNVQVLRIKMETPSVEPKAKAKAKARALVQYFTWRKKESAADEINNPAAHYSCRYATNTRVKHDK